MIYFEIIPQIITIGVPHSSNKEQNGRRHMSRELVHDLDAWMVERLLFPGEPLMEAGEIQLLAKFCKTSSV